MALCSRLRSPSALRASASTTSISAKVPSYGFLRRAQRRRAHRHPGRSVILTSLMGPRGGLERHPGTAAAARRDGPDHEPGRLRLIPRVLDAPRHLKHAAARLHTDLAVSGASVPSHARTRLARRGPRALSFELGDHPGRVRRALLEVVHELLDPVRRIHAEEEFAMRLDAVPTPRPHEVVRRAAVCMAGCKSLRAASSVRS